MQFEEMLEMNMIGLLVDMVVKTFCENDSASRRERVEKQKTKIVEPEQGRIQDFKLGGGRT
jgi:hypothetical protein